jgi:uncharacterized phage protein gp47/JayE
VPTFPTHADLYDAAKAEITSTDSRLTDFREGSALDASAGTSAMLAGEVMRWSERRFRACFVDTAEGSDLDSLITGLGGPARDQAAAAIAYVTLTRTSYSGAYTITAGTEVYGTAPNGQRVTFEVVNDIVLGSGAISIANRPAAAQTNGPDFNVPAATLVNIDGLPAGLVLTQPQRAAGGAFEQGDAAYREAFRLWRRTLAKGTPAALRYGALIVDGVDYATVDESNIADEDGGYVALYIGDPDAEGNDALVAAVELSLETGGEDGTGFRAAGVEVRVFASERDERTISITVRIRRGSGIVAADVKDALVSWSETIDPGVTGYLSAAEAAVHDIDVTNVLSADITVPTARELTPTEVYQAIRFAADGSGITVTLVEIDVGAM